MIANLLASYRTTVTMVTRTTVDEHEETGGGGGGGGEGVVRDSCGSEASKWEALQLQLSREDISRGVELESLLVRDLALRHK